MDIVSRQRINLLVHLSGLKSINSKSAAAEIIKRVANECEFSSQDLVALIKSPELIGSFGALSPNQKEQYFYNICELMQCSTMNSNTILLCHRLAHELGFDANKLESTIAQIRADKRSPFAKQTSQQEGFLLNTTV